jgi:serine/threonine protein kinase
MMSLKQSYDYLDKNVEIVKKLNSGSFGTVYLINDSTKEKHIALKIILINSEEKEYKFIKENEIQLQMKGKESPYVIKTYYSGLLEVVPEKFKEFKVQEKDRLGIIGMEYVEGKDLFEGVCAPLLKINSSLVREKLHLFLRVCYGVQFLHSNRIVHGDIKLENILCTMIGNNTVSTKLIDFDFSVIIPDGNRIIRNVNENRGTAWYNAPELYHLKILGFCSDIWALGVLFYVIFFQCIMYEDYAINNGKNLDEINEVIYVKNFDFVDTEDKPNKFYNFAFSRFEQYYRNDCEKLFGIFESMCKENIVERIKIDDLIIKIEQLLGLKNELKKM